MPKRTKSAQSMLTEEEYTELVRLAEADGRTVSDYLRILILRDLSEKK